MPGGDKAWICVGNVDLYGKTKERNQNGKRGKRKKHMSILMYPCSYICVITFVSEKIKMEK